MVNLCSRLVPVLISEEPCAVANIGILKVREMLFIKKSCFFQKFAAVDRRTGTGCENAVCFFKLADRFSLSSGKRSSKHIIVISGIVDFITLLVGNQLCAACKCIFPSADTLIQPFNKIRKHLRIIVQKNHIRLF